MRTIDEDIKNQKYKTAYLLYGEEAYLKKQYKDKLKSALWTEGDTMNAAFYQGKETNPKELIDLGETMPFFADHRLILVEDSGFFKSGVCRIRCRQAQQNVQSTEGSRKDRGICCSESGTFDALDAGTVEKGKQEHHKGCDAGVF